MRGLACSGISCILELCTFDFNDAGRLSRKRLAGLWSFGWSRDTSPSVAPTNDPWRALGKRPLGTLPGACHPIRDAQATAWPARQPLISVVSGLWPVDRRGRSPRGASWAAAFPAVSQRLRLFLSTVTPAARSSRVRAALVLAVLTRSLRCASGCGFRAPLTWPLTPARCARGYQGSGRTNSVGRQ